MKKQQQLLRVVYAEQRSLRVYVFNSDLSDRDGTIPANMYVDMPGSLNEGMGDPARRGLEMKIHTATCMW